MSEVRIYLESVSKWPATCSIPFLKECMSPMWLAVSLPTYGAPLFIQAFQWSVCASFYCVLCPQYVPISITIPTSGFLILSWRVFPCIFPQIKLGTTLPGSKNNHQGILVEMRLNFATCFRRTDICITWSTSTQEQAISLCIQAFPLGFRGYTHFFPGRKLCFLSTLFPDIYFIAIATDYFYYLHYCNIKMLLNFVFLVL